MSDKPGQYIKALSTNRLICLLVFNCLLIWLIYYYTSSPWGWTYGKLSDGEGFDRFDLFAILQILFFALTADQILRRIIVKFNKINEEGQIPKVIVQILTFLVYFFSLLVTFVILYDHSFSNIIAATSGMGIGILFLFKDRVADIMASVQLQTDRLVNAGDFIELTENEGVRNYHVIRMEQRRVHLRSISDNYERLIPNARFLSLNYINLTRQGPGRGSVRHVTMQLDSCHNSEKLIEIFQLALEKISTNWPDFFARYSCGASMLDEGFVTYKLIYECRPGLSTTYSDSLVLTTALRFLKAASFKLNAAKVLLPIDRDYSVNTDRLLNMYDLGILKVLSRNEVVELAKNTKTIYARAGTHLIVRNENANSMYLISEGVLEVSVPNKDGEPIVVAQLWPGDCVGEMSLLTGAPRSADVFIRHNAILIEIKKEDIAPVLEVNRELIHHMSNLLAERLEQNEKTLTHNNKNEELEEASKSIAKKIIGFFFG